MPRGISGAASTALGGEIVHAGGVTWENEVKLVLDDLQIYSLASDSWRPGPGLPAKAAYAPFVASPDGLEILGGTNGSAAVRARWKLDANKSRWTRGGHTPADTILGQAARIGNNVFSTPPILSGAEFVICPRPAAGSAPFRSTTTDPAHGRL
jgi:hypothetical protein